MVDSPSPMWRVFELVMWMRKKSTWRTFILQRICTVRSVGSANGARSACLLLFGIGHSLVRQSELILYEPFCVVNECMNWVCLYISIHEGTCKSYQSALLYYLNNHRCDFGFLKYPAYKNKCACHLSPVTCHLSPDQHSNSTTMNRRLVCKDRYVHLWRQSNLPKKNQSVSTVFLFLQFQRYAP